jgi:hypothetical protein
MIISNNADFAGAGWQTVGTSSSWELTSIDGTKTVYIKVKDTAGNISDVASDSIILDTATPTGTIIINNGDSFTNSAAATLALTSSATSGQMMISDNADFSGAAWEPFSATKSWTLSNGDGTKTVYAKFKSQSGLLSDVVNDTITLDTQAPSTTLSINSGAASTNSANVTLTISATDPSPSSGVTQMMVSNSSDFSGASWETYATSKPWTLTTGDGIKTVYIRVKDAATNESAVANDTISLATSTPPTGTVVINSNAVCTNSTSVTLTLTSSATNGQMMISNSSSFTGASWQAFSATKAWTLATGNGTKTVYVKFKDTAGNISTVVTDTILLDTVKPTGSILINNGACSTNSRNVTLKLSASDPSPASGVTQMMISNSSSFTGASWETYATSKAWTLTSCAGTKYVYVKYKDAAGNISSVYNDSICYTGL